MKYPSSLVYFTLSNALVVAEQNFFRTESLRPQSLRFCWPNKCMALSSDFWLLQYSNKYEKIKLFLRYDIVSICNFYLFLTLKLM